MQIMAILAYCVRRHGCAWIGASLRCSSRLANCAPCSVASKRSVPSERRPAMRVRGPPRRRRVACELWDEGKR